MWQWVESNWGDRDDISTGSASVRRCWSKPSQHQTIHSDERCAFDDNIPLSSPPQDTTSHVAPQCSVAVAVEQSPWSSDQSTLTGTRVTPKHSRNEARNHHCSGERGQGQAQSWHGRCAPTWITPLLLAVLLILGSTEPCGSHCLAVRLSWVKGISALPVATKLHNAPEDRRGGGEWNITTQRENVVLWHSIFNIQPLASV